MLDLLQLLAPAELPKVFDVLGENAIEGGDFQSVFDTFLEADIEGQLEEGLDGEALIGEVLETLTDEQTSLLVSFLVQVEIAIEDPKTELMGLFKKGEAELGLENEIPGSPGFALRSLEMAFEFTLLQTEKGEWSKEEGKTQLSAYLKHWLKHEPCLNCSEPTFFVANELVPATDFLQGVKAESKVLPQETKPTDLYLLQTQKSNFKIPFFDKYTVEEVKLEPKTQLQNEGLEKVSPQLAIPKDLQVKGEPEMVDPELLKNTKTENVEVKGKEVQNLPELKPDAKNVNESTIHKEVKVSVPQVQTRIDKALNWFAEQMQDIGKPESMNDDEWTKIMAWMKSKRSKSSSEALEQLDRLSDLKRIGSQNSKHARTLSEIQTPEELIDKKDDTSKTTKSIRFQKALSEVYQSVRSEETSEKAQQVLKNYTSDLPELKVGKEQQVDTKPTQEPVNSPSLNSKTSEVKLESTLPTAKPAASQSSGWDPELLNKFLQSTKETLKIWVDKKYTAMRIQIEPLELGKIQLKTIVEQGRIGVLIQAENQMTKELLQIHLHEMKEILKEQGLEVAGFQVDVKDQKNGFAEQKSSAAAKFELETLLEEENDGTENSSGQNSGLIDRVA